jgi:hypothetical protein
MQIRLHKLLAALFLGLLAGLQVHHSYVKWNHLGRAAFLEDQSKRFDMYMAKVHPFGLTIIGAIVALLGVTAVYELVAFGISKLLPPAPPESPIPQ